MVTSPLLTIDIIALFPSLFDSWLQQGVVHRAIQRGVARVAVTGLREFGVGRHRVTDDYSFGGGPGMVLKPEPVFAAVETLELAPDVPIILTSPAGRRFTHKVASELAGFPHFALIAGHYEGVDDRVRQHLVTDEISIGDYVVASGEIAAMVISDAVVRLVPGAISAGSVEEESFTEPLLEYPHYTRPANFRGWHVPEVLLSGHHVQIAEWRRQEAMRRTSERRPDLLPDRGNAQEKFAADPPSDLLDGSDS